MKYRKYKKYNKVTEAQKAEIKRLRAEPFCFTNKAIGEKLGLRTFTVQFYTGPKYKSKPKSEATKSYMREYNKYYRAHKTGTQKDIERLRQKLYARKKPATERLSDREKRKEYHRVYYKKHREEKIATVKARYDQMRAEKRAIKEAKIEQFIKIAKEMRLI